MMEMNMIMFPSQNPKSGGALVKSQYHTPSASGSIIYLNGNPNLQTVLDKVEAAGGKVTMPKMQIGEFGFMGFFCRYRRKYCCCSFRRIKLSS